MLRSFRVVNHRSFRDEQELLLMPSKEADATAVVPVTAVYGANASGKSSLLDGLRFMKEAVTQSFGQWDAEGSVPRSPFRLSPASRHGPSLFAVEIVVGGVPYTYGFAIDDERVLEEWLLSYPEKRPRMLFRRDNGSLKFGSTVSGELRSKLNLIGELTRPNALFLSACAQVQVAELMPVYRWFRFQLKMRMTNSFYSPKQTAMQVANLRARNPHLWGKLEALLRAADIGIKKVSVEEVKDPELTDRMSVIVDDISRLEKELKRAKDDVRRKDLTRQLDRMEVFRDRTAQRAAEMLPELQFIHGEEDEKFTLSEESAGTRSWLTLLPMVLEALDEGNVVAVDEIDTSLHPLLTVQLINLFRSKKTNTSGAQLIFTSHDSSLLGPMLGQRALERDEIWFVEKGRDGASTLYPLTDFKPREGYNNERRYLGGSYGAVPVLDFEEFAEAVHEA